MYGNGADGGVIDRKKKRIRLILRTRRRYNMGFGGVLRGKLHGPGSRAVQTLRDDLITEYRNWSTHFACSSVGFHKECTLIRRTSK